MLAWLKRPRPFLYGTAFGSVIGTVVGTGLTVAAGFALLVAIGSSYADDLASDQGCLGGTLTDEEYAQTARHEIGHTVVVLALEPGWFVRTDVFPSGVSVDEDGCASGVTTIEFPTSLTRVQLVESIAMEYGGYAIDLAVDGQPNSGASRDIRIATSRAIVGIDQYGMGRRVAPYDWGLLANQGFASDMDRARAEEVREMLDRGIALAELIVAQNRDQIDTLTQALLDSPDYVLDTDGVGNALIADIVFDPEQQASPTE